MPEQTLPNTWTFSRRRIIALLNSETLGSTSVLHLGVILDSEITNQKYKNVNNVALSKPPKGHLFIV